MLEQIFFQNDQAKIAPRISSASVFKYPSLGSLKGTFQLSLIELLLKSFQFCEIDHMICQADDLLQQP
jgi:hypothetical protein